ncbi:MAG: DEAD/DEAH box helicase [Eubacteriaceae bacterium]|nr:DEAD/DEAH box helicase [Eubacteriaceae bacterium]
MAENFQDFNLSPSIMRALDKLGFTNPTPVQGAAIQPMLDKKDLLVEAPTGTGKTAAFAIPALEALDLKDTRIQILVLCPTRELAIQTTAVFRELTTFMPGVKLVNIYGGDSMYRQIDTLKKKPQIVVATPGRMLDHLDRRTARFDGLKMVILDEADRILDMGFIDEIDDIMSFVPQERQTALFSATLSKEVQKIADRYQVDPEWVTIAQDTRTVEAVEQYYSEVKRNGKMDALLSLLEENNFDSCLIFTATKIMADELADELLDNGYQADALHGDLKQTQRERVMKKFRNKQLRYLVATDVASRGLDVYGIDAVVNYDIPDDVDSYIHRVGRTGRANNTGKSFTLIYSKDRSKLLNIIKSTKANIIPIAIDQEQRDLVALAAAEDRSRSRSRGSSRSSGSRSRSRSRGASDRSEYTPRGGNRQSDAVSRAERRAAQIYGDTPSVDTARKQARDSYPSREGSGANRQRSNPDRNRSEQADKRPKNDGFRDFYGSGSRSRSRRASRQSNNATGQNSGSRQNNDNRFADSKKR